ncbi:hypothetical protein BHE74_00047264 [Ensete ventricosum]|nr:hypothetical protein BHE74_00047264 [Ensete ventricosum]
MASALWRRALLRACGGEPPRFLIPSRRFSGEAPRRFAALWGNGDYGRLGLGGLESRWKPTVCPFFDDDPPVSIACGGAHTLFLTGTVVVLDAVVHPACPSSSTSVGSGVSDPARGKTSLGSLTWALLPWVRSEDPTRRSRRGGGGGARCDPSTFKSVPE